MFDFLLWTVFFIALLIDGPTDIAGDPVGDRLLLSDRSNETRDPEFLRGVCAISTAWVGAVLRLTP